MTNYRQFILSIIENRMKKIENKKQENFFKRRNSKFVSATRK